MLLPSFHMKTKNLYLLFSFVLELLMPVDSPRVLTKSKQGFYRALEESVLSGQTKSRMVISFLSLIFSPNILLGWRELREEIDFCHEDLS